MMELNNIERYNLKLTTVDVTDAKFILELRTDPLLARYLSTTGAKIEDQIDWIRNYKIRETQGLEYYFLTRDAQGNALGTTRLSELGGECFELGSWLFSRNAPQGAAILADIITKEIGFEMLGFDCCKFNVRKENKSVLKYHKNYLPKIIGETDLDIFFKLDKSSFNQHKNKFLKFYNNGN